MGYEEKKKDFNASFVLNEDGTMDQNAATNKILNVLNQTQNVKKAKFDSYDLLNSNTSKIGSDYIVKFKKKKRKKKKKKRKRNEIINDSETTIDFKKRKISKDEKYAFLNNSNNVTTKSRGKRDNILSALKLSEIEEQKEKQRLNRYNIALQKANKSMAANLALNDALNELNDDVDSDDDDIFNATLQRAQKLKEKAIKSQKNKPLIEEKAEDKNESVVYAENANDDGVVFSIATQFSDGLNGIYEQENESVHIAKEQQVEENKNVQDEMQANDEDDDIAMNESKGGWIEYDEDHKNKNQAKQQQKRKNLKQKGMNCWILPYWIESHWLLG